MKGGGFIPGIYNKRINMPVAVGETVAAVFSWFIQTGNKAEMQSHFCNKRGKEKRGY